MKRRIGLVFALILALATVAALTACAGENKQSEASGSATSLDASDSKLETGEYQGALAMAQKGQLTVSGDGGNMEFTTDGDTVYKLGDADEMCFDDIILVKYHVNGDSKVADEIDLVNPTETALEFAGTLTKWDGKALTLASKGSTVTFQTDSDTYIVGDLSQGDEVELTYLGNLNEYPYANVVAVVTEVEQPETLNAHGVVSEITETTFLLGIDSAHAYRFAISGNTKISGADAKIAVGDTVTVTYRGNISETPEAISINIVKREQNRTYIINGTITEVQPDSVTIETGGSLYAFGVSNSTKYTGEKPIKGYSAEITYTGSLNENPQAQIIYCEKDALTASKAVAKKKKAKKNSSTTDASTPKKTSDADGATQDKAQGDASSSSAAQQVKPQANDPEEEPDGNSEGSSSAPEPDPEDEPGTGQGSDEPEPESDVSVSGQGTIVSDGEFEHAIAVEVNGTELNLQIDDDTEIASGYIPEKGDVVKVVYGSTSMTLKKIQLISKAQDSEGADSNDEGANDAGSDEGTNDAGSNDASSEDEGSDDAGSDDAGSDEGSDDAGSDDEGSEDKAEEEE